MQTRKKIMRTALALTTGAILFAPGPLYSMDKEDAPEAVTIESMSNLYGPVEFDHLMHVDYASCEECHHHTTGVKVADPNCLRCHANTPEADEVTCSGCHEEHRFYKEYLLTLTDPKIYHHDKPGLKGAYHLNCIGCHELIDGPTGCQDCHAMTEAGEKRFNTGKYAPAGGASSGKHH